MFESYGSMVWSNQPTRPAEERPNPYINLAAASVTASAAFAYGTRVRPDGTRAIDDFVSYARTAGNLTPYQIGNTFRVPEFLSPFTSTSYQKLTPGNGKFSQTWKAESLNNSSTYSYMKELTGLTDSQLAAQGILPKNSVADLVFEKEANAINGSLFSQRGGKRELLRSNVMLMQYTGERNNLITSLGNGPENTPVNKAAKSVLNAMGMSKYNGFSETDLFAHKKHRPTNIPIPGIEVSSQGATYFRSLGAFQMERFNHLLSNIGGELFGPSFDNTVKRVLGSGLGVQSGPMSSMFLRIGGKAAAVGAIGLGVAESDWIRRQFGAPGQIMSSAAVAGGLGVLASRAGFKGKTSALIAGGAFVGQMLLPGFDKGIVPGLATTYTKLDTARGSDLNPYNYYRRTVEGFFPGMSSFGMIAGVGLAAASIPHLKIPGTGKRVPQILLDQLGHTTLGFKPKTISGLSVKTPLSVRDLFWDNMMSKGLQELNSPGFAKAYQDYAANGHYSTMKMRNRVMKEFTSKLGPAETSKMMETLFATAETKYDELARANPINHHMVDELRSIAGRYSGKGDFISRASMQAEGIATQLKHSFFGAVLHEETTSKAMKGLGFRSPLGSFGLLFAGAATAYGLATGGLLGSMQSSQELSDIYGGRQLVEVKKGRFWEAGGTPWEGGLTSQLRPHWYPIMMARAQQAGVWGDNEDQMGPIGKWLTSNLTYELEKQNYYDRPYPISGAAFANVPVIGGILSSTIGRIVKPSKVMHANEWIRESAGNLEYGSLYEGWKREPSYNLGAYKPGIPISPYGVSHTVSQLNYQAQELAGLTGWIGSLIQEKLTGKSYYYSDSPVLADSSAMSSFKRTFLDAQLGGMGPVGEIIRRILPSSTKDIERTNPLANTQPSWLPEKFHYGDPYAQLPYGEAVLPGAGYAALHPELRGVESEDYPLLHRYNILSQVAPLSKEFRKTKDQIYRARAGGMFSPDQEAYIDRLDSMTNKLWAGWTDERRDPNAIRLPGSGIVSNLQQGFMEFTRKGLAPLEYLTPFRPLQKFLGNRDPIEQYEYERLYGSSVAFWNKPGRDFLRPAIYSLAHFMGFEGKPMWRHDADATNEYFDKIEFSKWMSMAEQAAVYGDTQNKIRYEYLAANTRMGVNPQGNPLSIYWSLPNEDRVYFNAFATATGKDRERISQMVPADQVHLYKALWSRIDQGDPGLWPANNTSPDRQYLQGQYAQLDKSQLPPDDWIGYNTDIDTRDIKVRYLHQQGKELRDFGLWEQEVKKAYSQPYLEGSEQAVSSYQIARGWLMHGMNEVFDTSSLSLTTSNGLYGTMDLSYNDDRSSDVSNMLMERVNAY